MADAKSVTIVDYGIGNLRSIEKAFEAIGATVHRTDRPDDLRRADRLVLPGVGAFGACIGEIRRRGLEQPIRAFVETGRPFIGVCVGMQLLFEESDERGQHTGLGLLPGRVVRFPERSAASDELLKVPHMGWNTIEPRLSDSLFEGLPQESFFYFVHSYHPQPSNDSDILATTEYGHTFPAVVGRDNVFGVQFHPEKSQHNGLRILRNFAALPLPN